MLWRSSIWRHSRPRSLLASRPGLFYGPKSTRHTRTAADSLRTASSSTSTMYKYPQPSIQDPIDHKMSLTPDKKSGTFGNFDLLQRVKLDYTDVEISRWQSRETGLNITHIDFDGEYIQHRSATLISILQSRPHCEWILCRWYRKYVNPVSLPYPPKCLRK